MKITAIRTFRVEERANVLWVHVETDAGIVGLGETFYGAGSVEAHIHDVLAGRLLGKDPLRIEAHSRELVNLPMAQSSTGAEYRAASAIDLALWDERMMARGHGKIINIGSLTSELARATVAPYTVAKGGIKMLTKAMAAEWGEHGIQANAIGPGYMLTDMNEALVANPQFDGWVKARTPARRWGRPEELAGGTDRHRRLPRLFGLRLRQRPDHLCRRRNDLRPLRTVRRVRPLNGPLQRIETSRYCDERVGNCTVGETIR